MFFLFQQKTRCFYREHIILGPDTYSEIAQIMPSLQSCLKPPMKSNAIAHRINKFQHDKRLLSFVRCLYFNFPSLFLYLRANYQQAFSATSTQNTLLKTFLNEELFCIIYFSFCGHPSRSLIFIKEKSSKDPADFEWKWQKSLRRTW